MSTTTARPAVTALSTDVSMVTNQLNSILPHLECMESNIIALQSSTPVGSVLTTQLNDVATIFTTIADVFSFLDDIKILDNVFGEASKTIASQQQQCQTIITEIPKLKNIVSSISTQITDSEKQIPSSSDINTILSRIKGWQYGADSLSSLLDSIATTASGDSEQSQLASVNTAFNNGCQTLSSKAQSISTICTNLLEQTKSINANMVAYANALLPVANHSVVIASSSMQNLDEIASKMKYINAILNPISIVLNVSGCSDPASKASSAAALDAVKTSSTSVASDVGSVVATAINDFTNSATTGYLPLTPLYQDILNAQNTLNSDSLSQFSKNIQSLISTINSLNTAISGSNSYSVEGKQYDNLFLNSSDITQLNNLITSISTQK